MPTPSFAIPRPRHDVALLLLGGAIFATGFILGALAGADPARADPPGFAGRGGGAEFGFAVPAQGFAVVKGEDRGAYVINSRGEAMRVLVAINPSASDQPRAGTTAQLPLD